MILNYNFAREYDVGASAPQHEISRRSFANYFEIRPLANGPEDYAWPAFAKARNTKKMIQEISIF